MVLLILLGVGVLGFFIWLIVPMQTDSTPTNEDAAFIDPDDSYQIGLLTGLTGGSIPDAAVMRFALQRFKQMHGRQATSKDIGIVLGLIEATK